MICYSLIFLFSQQYRTESNWKGISPFHLRGSWKSNSGSFNIPEISETVWSWILVTLKALVHDSKQLKMDAKDLETNFTIFFYQLTYEHTCQLSTKSKGISTLSSCLVRSMGHNLFLESRIGSSTLPQHTINTTFTYVLLLHIKTLNQLGPSQGYSSYLDCLLLSVVSMLARYEWQEYRLTWVILVPEIP